MAGVNYFFRPAVLIVAGQQSAQSLETGRGSVPSSVTTAMTRSASAVSAIMLSRSAFSAGSGGALCEPPIRDYWEPTGIWYVQEILATSLSILEEVPAISERDV